MAHLRRWLRVDIGREVVGVVKDVEKRGPGRRNASSSHSRLKNDARTSSYRQFPAGKGGRGFVRKWRATADEDGHYSLAIPL